MPGLRHCSRRPTTKDGASALSRAERIELQAAAMTVGPPDNAVSDDELLQLVHSVTRPRRAGRPGTSRTGTRRCRKGRFDQRAGIADLHDAKLLDNTSAELWSTTESVTTRDARAGATRRVCRAICHQISIAVVTDRPFDASMAVRGPNDLPH